MISHDTAFRDDECAPCDTRYHAARARGKFRRILIGIVARSSLYRRIRRAEQTPDRALLPPHGIRREFTARGQ